MTTTRMNRPRVGLVTLGQGPRPEFERLHHRLFRTLGLEVDIVSRHALDGIESAELQRLEASDGTPAIHSNIRGPCGFASPLGKGWSARWIDRDRLVPLVQTRIDELEEAEKVDVTICCVAEAFPTGSFISKRPFILPAMAMISQAEILASTRPEARIGVIVHGARQRLQQMEGWAAIPWSRRLSIHFAGDGTLDQAIEELRSLQPDLVFLWAYAAGLGPSDGNMRLADLADAAGAPVIVPAIAASMAARNFLSPPLAGGRPIALNGAG